MDFLGLRTLTVIQDTVDLVKQNRGINIEFDREMNDPKVYKQWQTGNSMGIFQFESQGMTNFMKELQPDCLEDIIAGVSLYRPGPMDQIPRYIANKQDPEHAVYTHPALKPILEVTYRLYGIPRTSNANSKRFSWIFTRKSRLSSPCHGKEKARCNGERKRIFHTWSNR